MVKYCVNTGPYKSDLYLSQDNNWHMRLKLALADRRKQLKLCSLFQMMNGQISFPMANAPLVGRPALNLRNWIFIFLYNQLYTQVHISFSSFPMLSFCGIRTNYQTLCMTVRLLSFKHCICTLYQWMLVVYVVTCSVVSFVFLLFILYRLGT